MPVRACDTRPYGRATPSQFALAAELAEGGRAIYTTFVSLKYRLIILSVAVFVAAFAVSAALGLHAAGRLAEAQLQARLARSAQALARSHSPLNAQALARYEPLLDAQIMVLSPGGALEARTAAAWPWDELAEAVMHQLERSGTPIAANRDLGPLPQPPSSGTGEARLSGGRYHFAWASGLAGGAASEGRARQVWIVLLADESPIRAATAETRARYLAAPAATALLLAAGMYLVGWALVRRVKRLQAEVEATVADEHPRSRRGGGRNTAFGGPDEIARLGAAFADLQKRLDVSRQRLAAQQRLAVTGQLASSIAHEVRNPLQAIRLTAQMLRESAPADGRRGFDLILAEIDRLSLLTDELLVLAGKDTLRVEPVDLAAQLGQTLRLLEHQLRLRGVRAELSLPALPPVRMDANRCRQLLLNLLLNALEAAPRDSAIRIDGVVAEGSVTLRIADRGPGFPPQVLQGQAEEFFSTKSTGAGLGLSICRKIIQQAGGELRLFNAPEGGAVAEVVVAAA